MSRLSNSTQLKGNLGSDPETRYLQNGTVVHNVSLAVTETWKDSQTKERREKTTWWRLAFWGDRWDNIIKYLQKGSAILVEGTATCSAYMGNDGQPKASLELKVRDFEFAGGKQSSGDHQRESESQSSYTRQTDREVDDIPF